MKTKKNDYSEEATTVCDGVLSDARDKRTKARDKHVESLPCGIKGGYSMVKYTELGNARALSIDQEAKPCTAPYDPRFPNQNQTRYCFVSFLDFQRCKKRHGEEYDACQYFYRVYNSMCPNAWKEKWNDQLEEGTFPVKL